MRLGTKLSCVIANSLCIEVLFIAKASALDADKEIEHIIYDVSKAALFARDYISIAARWERASKRRWLHQRYLPHQN